MTKKENRLEALKELQAKIDKKFGAGSLLVGNENLKNLDRLSSGSFLLDGILGGGLPKGRIIEIFGPESSGKSTLSLLAIAQAQKEGGIVAFVDAEHALDRKYAQKLGVDMNTLLLSQPDCGEDALSIVEELVESGQVSVVVIDSVAALTPKKEIEGEMGDSHMGLQARLMSQALRKITAVAQKNNVTLIFINQIRMKIGVMFGSPETVTGGQALKFYASVRLDVRAKEKITEGDNIIGHIIRVKTVKNKTASPHQEVLVPLIYGKGIDSVVELYTMAKDKGVIHVAGAHHYMDETKKEKLASSAAEMIEKLKTDTKLYKTLADKVKSL